MSEVEKWYNHFNNCCEFKKDLENDFVGSYLVKCPYCGGENLKEQNYDYINSTVCEYDYYCEDCKTVVGGWSYGTAHD